MHEPLDLLGSPDTYEYLGEEEALFHSLAVQAEERVGEYVFCLFHIGVWDGVFQAVFGLW